jgi:NAD+ kinase
VSATRPPASRRAPDAPHDASPTAPAAPVTSASPESPASPASPVSPGIEPAKGARVVVLVKRSSYRTFVEEGEDARVKRLIASSDPTVSRMRRSHEAHAATLLEVKAALAALGARPEFQEGPRTKIEGRYDLVVTVGGDGTLLAASHQIGPETPILGVNSAPESSVGFFCAARAGTVKDTLAAALSGRLRGIELARMRVDVNEKLLHNRVLNEALFCHASPAATSRYILRVTHADGTFDEEEQKSSGLWIGPAAGSTAAQKSAGGRVLPLTSRRIQYVVREPYAAAGRELRHLTGLVDEDGRITLRSKMRQAKIFLDGHHNVFEAEIGDVITLRRSDETLTVLGLVRNGDTKAPPKSSRGR